ncbi:50S ribosomal protein L25 [Candidatus Saccharibacteria bacterium]|nr:50S ribosomal protein L25 [Candidatus Saccharibacteria bacterium]
MSDVKLSLEIRTIAGKKLAGLRADGFIPSVIYGGKEPILAQSPYNDTEKALKLAGYHSPIDLNIDGKKTMAIAKNVAVDPVSRKILNVEFQSIRANQAVEATTPIVIVNFEESEAFINLHLAVNQALTEINVKAKPANLPKELTLDASGFTTIDDKFTVSDLVLPEGVEFANQELDMEQVVASLHDPAAEAAAREAAEAAEAAAAAEVAAAEEGAEGEGTDGEAAEGESAEGEKSEGEKSEGDAEKSE